MRVEVRDEEHGHSTGVSRHMRITQRLGTPTSCRTSTSSSTLICEDRSIDYINMGVWDIEKGDDRVNKTHSIVLRIV